MKTYQFIFDFDCTLTYRHFYLFYYNYNKFKSRYNIFSKYDILQYKFVNNNILSKNEKEDIINLIFNRIRYVKLAEYLTYLKQYGELVISSRGTRNSIIRCLEVCNLIDFFDKENIHGNEKKKDELILKKLRNNINIIYIDDNHEEHNIIESHIRYLNEDDCFKYYKFNDVDYIFCNILEFEKNGINNFIIERYYQYILNKFEKNHKFRIQLFIIFSIFLINLSSYLYSPGVSRINGIL
jgi:hypothetical protein